MASKRTLEKDNDDQVDEAKVPRIDDETTQDSDSSDSDSSNSSSSSSSTSSETEFSDVSSAQANGGSDQIRNHSASDNNGLSMEISRSEADSFDFLQVGPDSAHGGPVDPTFVDEDDSNQAEANLEDFDDSDDDNADDDEVKPEEPPPLPTQDKPLPPPLPLDANEANAHSKDKSTDIDSDVSFDEVDQILDEDLKAGQNKTNDGDEEEPEVVPSEVQRKILLVEKGKPPLEALPEGWIQTVHKSGMPVYLHKASRVACITRPYFLGPGSIRRHSIPVEAVPCLSYKKALDAEEAVKERKCQGNDTGLPQAKLQVVDDETPIESVKPEDFRQYCSKLFQFKEVEIQRFKSWKEKRKFNRQTRNKKVKSLIEMEKQAVRQGQSSTERPTHLPKGTKLITIPVVEMESISNNSQEANPLSNNVIRKSKKEWMLNPTGKSFVYVLHEYVQHSSKMQPKYKFAELESSVTPYSACAIINGVEYAMGYGSSKKNAKNEAARKALEILIPDMKEHFAKTTSSAKSEGSSPDLTFFDKIAIDDEKVPELCNQTSEPSPYAILVTCLQRNYGLGDTSIHTELRQMRHKKNEFYMRVQQKEVSVICDNKRDGKQKAAQKLLQQLHPDFTNWGQLLQLYGSRAIMGQKAKKERESEITGLQSRNASRPAPSLAILDKLREEMAQLAKMKHSVTDVGKLMKPIDADVKPMKNSCLDKVDF